MKTRSGSVERFKALLNVLFQFDAAELDFGIYRIMNHRRKEIENFIEKDLIQAVAKEFQVFKAQSLQELLAKIGEKKKEIEKLEKDLGEKILTNGQVEEKFKDRPFAKEYLEQKKQLDEMEVTESEQAQVFNDLYIFLSRYYEDGDFISKRRYSSRDTRYAIPYNGEEVKLYWANFDQYYVKTGEVFKDYEFDSNGWRIIFRTTFADVESGNVKGERRYFLLEPSDSLNVDKENKACLIQFEYRQLTEVDLSKYKVKTKGGEEKKIGIQQDELNTILNGMILEKIKELELKSVLSEEQDKKTILEKHLYRYTHKITNDFFVHKNLRGFLDRELDYFIKTEVLDIDNLDPRHFTRARVVENIGKRVIEFLAGIEDYQKFLWEKKKFVLRTDYVITTDRIPEELMEEVLGCKAQLQEWQDLGFGQISKKKDLNGKKLPVDTKHFDDGFKERFLEKLSEQGNFDDLIDGTLVKGENWQALNLVIGKYLGKVQTVYIDPPFNTGKDFLFKDKYQDSSWIALMENRLALGKQFLKDSGSLFLHLDWNANYIGRFLLNEIFGKNNFLNEIVWRIGWLSGYKTMVERFVRNHDTLLFYAATNKNASFFDKENARIPYSSFDRDTIKREIQSILQKWNISAKIKNLKVVFKDHSGKVYKLGLQQKDGGYPLEDTWNCSDYEELHSNKIKRNAKEYTPKGAEISQKPEQLLRRIIELTTAKKDIVLDYFLGTGTSTAVAHKLGRRWLGVEMGDYFETDVLYRMKHVLAGQSKREPCGISKEVDWQGGGFFKYHYLEQYEDTLHNIEFPNEGKGQMLRKLFPDEASEYVMRYMLWHETEGSASLLNVKQFESPFEYKLRIISDGDGEKIVPVDLIETFNYLLGLTVGRFNFLSENGRKYVIVLGDRENRRAAVVWRSTKDIDLEKDKEVIEQAISDFHPDQIFVNGDAYIKDYKVIESEFKALMGV